MVIEVWNDDWINIKKNEIFSNGKFLLFRYFLGNFIESRFKRYKVFF